MKTSLAGVLVAQELNPESDVKEAESVFLEQQESTRRDGSFL